MNDIAEMSNNPVAACESEEEPPSPAVNRQIGKRPKTRRARNLPLDDKSMDRLVRIILAFPKELPRRTTDTEHKEISRQRNSNAPGIDDLIDVHLFASATFGEDHDDKRKILLQIFAHQALEPLTKPAKCLASVYIFQAQFAYRLKTEGKYWVLGGLGAAYPYPLAIRTGATPCWKRQIRSLERLLKELRKSASCALRLEADSLVSSRPQQMPSELICDAVTAVRQAVSWMQAFPSAVSLRSQYREIMRPDAASESVRVVAYVLDRLYREHAGDSSVKVKDIECRIAELERTLFGQNIQYSSDFGCPAVRLQIRAMRRSKVHVAIDRSFSSSLKTIEKKLRENDPNQIMDAWQRLWKSLNRHEKVYDAWREGTESRLKQELSRALGPTTDTEEAFEAAGEYSRQILSHLDLSQRWIEEYRGHLEVLKSPDREFWQHSKAVRKWMTRWESLWEFSRGNKSGVEEAGSQPEV